MGGSLLLMIRPFHNEPSDIGLRPLGAPDDEPITRRHTDDTAKIRTRVFLRQAQRTSAFWNLIGIHFWGLYGPQLLHSIFGGDGHGPGLITGNGRRGLHYPYGLQQ